jgi:hypothetical protein
MVVETNGDRVSLKSFLNGNYVMIVILKIIRKNNCLYNIVDVEYMIYIISYYIYIYIYIYIRSNLLTSQCNA